jgi:hypothetical protein
MAQVPTGTTFFIASAYSAAINVTAITNASEAVVTTASAHTYSNGDIIEITSGWGRLNKRNWRIKAASGSTLTLEGADTSSTSVFPTGSGTGSIRKISTYTQVAQVLAINSSGGDPKNVTYKYMESDVEFNINDGFASTQMTMDLDADSIGTAGYTALKTLTDVQTDTSLKITTRNGAVIYQPCTVALNEAVQFQDGQVNRVRLAINSNGRLVRYAS